MGRGGTRPYHQGGNARLVLLVLVAFVVGAGVTTLWFKRSQSASSTLSQSGPENASQLSDSTRALLGRLNGTLQVHFYALLDPKGVSEATRAFAQRASQLLGQYEQQAGGKLKLTRYQTASRANLDAAKADGLQGFTQENGDVGYLGVALTLGAQKEALPQLSPEWEAALESDLTRAIDRLIDAARPTPGPVTEDTTAAEKAVQTLIPNVAAVSVEEGTRLIRESALKAFREAATEMQERVKEAQQQLADAQNGKSETEQQAAMQHLQQVQAEQAAKLREISAKAEAEVQALKRLKAGQ